MNNSSKESEDYFFQFIILISLLLTLFYFINIFLKTIINIAFHSYFSNYLVYSTNTYLIVGSLTQLFFFLAVIFYFKNNLKDNRINENKIIGISIKMFITIFILFLGLIVYIFHFLIYYLNKITPIKGILVTYGYSLTFYDNFHLILLICYFGIVIPVTEELFYRKFLINYFSKWKLELLPVSLLVALIYLLSNSWLFLTTSNTMAIFVYLVTKFLVSLFLSVLYKLTKRLYYTIILNIAFCSYLLFHQLALSNLRNDFLVTTFLDIKSLLIYSSFILIGIIIILYLLNKLAIPKLSSKISFSYPEYFFSDKMIIYLFIFIIAVPNLLDYFISNIFIFKPALDVFQFFIVRLVIFLIIFALLIRKKIDLHKLKTFKELTDFGSLDTSNYIYPMVGLKSKLQKYRNFNIKLKIIVPLKIAFKALEVYLLLLPLFYLSLNSKVKSTFFGIFQIESKIDVTFNQSILFSLFNITSNIGGTFGSKNTVFLRNINDKYFFLPTTYYTNPIDWVYGFIGTIIWFICIITLLKIIKLIVLSEKKSPYKKIKLFGSYLIILLVWNIFNFGLLKPSSFLNLSKRSQSSTSASSFFTASFKDLHFYFLPFGFLLIICFLLYYFLVIFYNVASKRFKNKSTD